MRAWARTGKSSTLKEVRVNVNSLGMGGVVGTMTGAKLEARKLDRPVLGGGPALPSMLSVTPLWNLTCCDAVEGPEVASRAPEGDFPDNRGEVPKASWP